MELRHFRYLIAVAEELHFGHAAARLHVSQPPLSHQIRMLEKELGVKLFERTKRRVQVTEAGLRLVEQARLVLAHADHAAKVAVSASKGELGYLTVGMTWERKVLIDTLRVFAKRCPDVHVELHRLSGCAQIQALRDGRLHVGFIFIPPPVEEPTLTFEAVGWDSFVIGLPQHHPLASRDHVPLRALASDRFISFQRSLNPGLYDQMVTLCRKAGFSLEIVHEVNDIYSGMTLVASGFGVCLFPASAADVERKGLVFRKLDDHMPRLECALVFRNDVRSNVVSAFRAVVREVAKKTHARRATLAALAFLLHGLCLRVAEVI